MARIKPWMILAVLTVLLMVAIASCQPSSPTWKGDLILASKGFTEQDILQELLAQQIEHQTQLKVDRRRLVGFVAHKALVAGDIDGYVEYTGTAYTGILKQKAIPNAPVVFDRLKQLYAQQFNLEVLPSLGFENTFAMIIRREDAQRYGIQTLSQAAQYSSQWRGGFGYEFLEREDGFPGLAKVYQLRFARPPQIMDLGLIYRALLQQHVDLIAGNSTDGQIARLDLVVLQDDQHYFPPYETVPILRQATLEKYPQVKTAIAQLSGKISAAEMQKMNYLVEGELRDIPDVVQEFLQAKGLITAAATFHPAT